MVFEMSQLRNICLSFVVLMWSHTAHSRLHVKNVTGTLERLLSNYDQKIRPGYPDMETLVKVDIVILDIGDVSESRMEFSLHCYFRQQWKDPRLEFSDELDHIWDNKDDATEVNSTQEASIWMPLNAQRVLNEIWRPDTYIRNGKHSFLHKLTVPNRLLRIRSDGLILLSQRLTITARCLMKLKRFPMDKQLCELQIGSLGYTDKELRYEWPRHNNNAADDILDSSKIAQFKLMSLTDDTRTMNSVRTDENSSVLVKQLEFHRQQGYYVLQIYVPCSMIVMLSWVSFWINQQAAIARCSLGVMTVMTLTTLRLGVREEFPPVHYATAIDIFLLVSFGFVLAAMVEYIVIHYTHMMEVRKIREQQKQIAGFEACRTGRSLDNGRFISFTTARARFTQSQSEKKRANSARWCKDIRMFDAECRGILHLGSFPQVEQAELSCRTVEEPTDDNDNDGDFTEDGMRRQPALSASITRKIYLIDMWSQILFPATYIIFHVSYWLFYIFYAGDE